MKRGVNPRNRSLTVAARSAVAARSVVAARARCAGAFTLVELLVSLAVLSVALSVVGVVFTVTTKTVSQAAAISEVHAVLRQFMLQLEEDLSGVEPSRSVLIVSGWTQRGALNADDLAARASWRVLLGNPADVASGYDPRLNNNVDGEYSNPRTDVLSFMTSRPMASMAPGTSAVNRPFLLGAIGAPVQVVYGHAAFDDAVQGSNGAWSFADATRHIYAGRNGNQLSQIPVGQWHVARRATILRNDKDEPLGWPNGLDFDDLRRSYSGNDSRPGDISAYNVNSTLAWASQADFVRDSPYQPSGALLNWANRMLYGERSGAAVANRHVATVIPRPPAALRSNLGVHMLPGCAWFQVEFLMPEDPRNSIDYFDPRTGPQRNFRTDMPQWTEVEEGETYIFVPDTAANRASIASEVSSGNEGGVRLGSFISMDITDPENIEKKRIRTWPYAIRITVRVFDPLGRLDEPIVRSLIHRFD